MSFLSIPVLFPVWFPLLLGLLWLITAAGFIYYWWDDRKFCPEKPIIKQSRKTGIPVLKIHAQNGFFRHLLGEKERKGSILYKFDKTTQEGIRIDPRIQSGRTPKSFGTGGLEMFDMSTSCPVAIGATNAAAYSHILDYTREHYPDLKFFDGQTVLEVVSTDRNDLPGDIRNLIETMDINIEVPEDKLQEFAENIEHQISEQAQQQGKTLSEEELSKEVMAAYNQDVKAFVNDYRANYLIKRFMQLQDELVDLPLPSRKLFSFSEAFQNIGLATFAGDLQTAFHYFEMIAIKQQEGRFENMIKWIIGAGVFLVMVAFAYMIWQGAPKR